MSASTVKPSPTIPSAGVPQVRPWVRWAARAIDMAVAGLVIGFLLGLVAPSVMAHRASVMIIILLWVFLEAALLSSWGITPGKWLLRTTVRDRAGQKLDFSTALRRSFSVWWRGMGIGFPLATLITMILAYNKLTKEGSTSWDRDGGFVVSHTPIGTLRGTVAVLFLVGLSILAIYERVARPTGS